jgi:periplasmic divalent cation tolerance protein
MLVERRLAACVNIAPGLTSVYLWEGRIERAEEHLLLIKTGVSAYDGLEAAIREHHPYELPEIVAVPIERGSRDYLQWITECLAPKS